MLRIFVMELQIVNVKSTPRGGLNRCMANLVTNAAELKINCNTLSVTKECSRISSEGLWTISSKFLYIRVEVDQSHILHIYCHITMLLSK